MAESVSYDELQQKYENAKNLIKQISDAFAVSLEELTKSLQKHSSDQNREFTEELTTVIQSAQSTLGPLFENANDPGLFEPTKLQQQIAAFDAERAKGLEMIRNQKQKIVNLEEQLESLNAEKSNWTIREQTGKKMIDQLNAELNQLKSASTMKDNATNPPPNGMIPQQFGSIDPNTNVVQELTDELEIAHSNAGDLRGMVSSLTAENKSLSSNVIALREQDNNRLSTENASLKKRLSAQGGNTRQLYRTDTQSEWKPEDLAELKEELRKEMRAQQADTIHKMTERQFELVAPSAPSADPSDHPQVRLQVVDDQNQDFDFNDEQSRKRSTSKLDRAFRANTKTEWNENEMESLKQEMKSELNQQNKKRLANMYERNAELRPSQPNPSPSHLAVNAPGYGYVESQDMEEIVEKQQKEEREREHREAMRLKEIEEQQAEMNRLRKQELAATMDKDMELRAQPTDPNKKIVVSPAETGTMEQALAKMKKEDMLHRMASAVHTVEPQIKEEHEKTFRELMKDIGIVNQQQVQTLWTQIDVTVNKDKRLDIATAAGGHGTSASTMLSDDEDDSVDAKFRNEVDSNAVQELRDELREVQMEREQLQTESVEKERKFDKLRVDLEEKERQIQELKEQLATQDEDDDVINDPTETPVGPPIVDTKGDHETPRGPDPDTINHVELEVGADTVDEMKEVIMQLKQEKMSMKSHYDAESQRMKLKQEELKAEVDRAWESKMQLLRNTSGEIDSLRKLLSDYVVVARKYCQHKCCSPQSGGHCC